MSKDPAFLFYPNDWIGGTMGMTFEEKGAYMELLMMQFNRGHMTEHMIGQTVGQFWDKIKDKFVTDDNGLYYNQRLDIEKEKRKAFTESRRNNISGINQYKKSKGHMVGHTTSHMENENVNENIIVNRSRKFIKPNIREISNYCKERNNQVNPDKFFDFYESKGWIIGKSSMRDWKAAIRTWEKNTLSGNNRTTKLA